MPTFPHLKSTAVMVYRPWNPDDLRGKQFGLARLADLLHDRWMERFVPEDLATLDNETTTSERWGWCYPDNRDNVLHAHHYIAFGTRRWVKKIPSSLVKAYVQQYEEDLREEGKLSRKARKAKLKGYKEEITRRLARETPPTVEEQIVVWDDEHKRLVIFNKSGTVRDTLAADVGRILEGMFSCEINLDVESLHSHLGRSRATASLPGNTTERFWTWLLSNAAADRTKVLAVPVGDETKCYTVVLGNHYKTAAGDTIKDDQRAAAHIQKVLDKGETGVNPMEVDLLVSDEPAEGGWRWTIRLNTACQCISVKLEDKRDTDSGGDYEGMALTRADALLAAHDFVHMLISAYDCGPLAKQLAEAPQAGLFPVEARTGGSWISMDEYTATYAPQEPIPEETPIERAARLGLAVVHSDPTD